MQNAQDFADTLESWPLIKQGAFVRGGICPGVPVLGRLSGGHLSSGGVCPTFDWYACRDVTDADYDTCTYAAFHKAL